MDTSVNGDVYLGSNILSTIGSSWSTDGMTYTIPYSGLNVSTAYTVLIQNFHNANGFPMSTYDTSHSFTTGSVATTYTISASPTTLNFGSLQTPYTQPTAQTVTITNTGTGSVTLTQPTATGYVLNLSPLNLAPGASATLTVQPKAGLAAGTYNETINCFTGSDNLYGDSHGN